LKELVSILLLYFLAGMIFNQAISPILESITTLILAGVEVLKSKMSIIIHKNNETIRSLGEGPPVHAIGFAIPEEEYEEDEF
jgi:hypothetical protein